MTTIFEVHNSEGCVGRCDAKCHNAKEFDCRCICGGALHGVGSKIAVEDSRHLTDDDITDECRTLGNNGRLWVFRDPLQLELF